MNSGNLITILTSPIWWLTVVIAGIVINLISAYLKSFMDKRLSSSFAWWRTRSNARRAFRIATISMVAADPVETKWWQWRVLRSEASLTQLLIFFAMLSAVREFYSETRWISLVISFCFGIITVRLLSLIMAIIDYTDILFEAKAEARFQQGIDRRIDIWAPAIKKSPDDAGA